MKNKMAIGIWIIVIVLMLIIPSALLSYCSNLTSIITTLNGYYGSVVGAAVTIIAVVLTFRHERKMTEQQNRLQLMPRFNITKINHNELCPDHPIWTEKITVNSNNQNSGKFIGRIGYCFQNVGLANAVSVTLRIYLGKEKIYAIIQDAILKDGCYRLIFSAHYAKEDAVPFDEKNVDGDAELHGYHHTIEILYSDLNDNKYRQTIDALFVVQEVARDDRSTSRRVHVQIRNINSPERMAG